MMKDLSEGSSAKIIPKLHIRGMREACGIIESVTMDVDQELESNKTSNLGLKERKLEKISESKKTNNAF